MRKCKHCTCELTDGNTITYKPTLLCCTSCYKEIQRAKWATISYKYDRNKGYVKNRFERVCYICKRDFVTGYKTQHTCSDECRYQWKLLYARAKYNLEKGIKMRLSDTIKYQCFIAFVHSRLIGLGSEDEEGYPVHSDPTKTKTLDDYNKDLAATVGKICTIKKVNSKIDNRQSVIIANQYHDSYVVLLKELDRNIPKDAEIIQSLLGVVLLDTYVKNVKEIPTIDSKKLAEVIDTFKNESTVNRGLVGKMIRVAVVITAKYFKLKA